MGVEVQLATGPPRYYLGRRIGAMPDSVEKISSSLRPANATQQRNQAPAASAEWGDDLPSLP